MEKKKRLVKKKIKNVEKRKTTIAKKTGQPKKKFKITKKHTVLGGIGLLVTIIIGLIYFNSDIIKSSAATVIKVNKIGITESNITSSTTWTSVTSSISTTATSYFANNSVNSVSIMTVHAVVAPINAINRDVIWTSSNSEILKVTSYRSSNVSAGNNNISMIYANIQGVNPGTAILTATSQDGSGVKVSIPVTVEPVKMKSLALKTSESSLTSGSKYLITSNVTPSNTTNQKLTWISSNSSVATVINVNGSYYVNAIKLGKTTLTATAQDGSGVKASITVNVIK